MENIKEYIIEESKKGNVVINTCEGLAIINLDELIDQPTEGLLYDLNRNECTILTFIDDPKWINDYATCQVIRRLKERLEL